MLAKLKKRITNKRVFLAIVSAVLVILVQLGVVDVEMSAKVEDVSSVIAGLLVSIGIFANPESHIKE